MYLYESDNMAGNRIEDLVKAFNRANGDKRYSERDLLKYLISKIDILDGKIDETNHKLDNHITTISERLAKIETTISIFKWLSGFFISALLGIIIVIVKVLLGV